MSSLENIDNLTPEELLGPPKYDAIGILMVFLTGLIVGVLSGVIIIVLAYFTIGRFSLETGASPMILAMITFLALTIGNILTYIIRSRVFPHIYYRSRTAVSQIATMSILLYIIFVPVYLFVSTADTDASSLYPAFSLHILLNVFTLELIIGLISQYRYSLLSLYASILSGVITALILFFLERDFAHSLYSLFLLFAFTSLAYTLAGFFVALLFWIYYRIYRATGYDPIGILFARIENEEKEEEKQATATLTHF